MTATAEGRFGAGAGSAYIAAMAEAFDITALSAGKAERYAEVTTEIAAVLEGEPDRVARMATVASMLAASFATFFWTGFYVVDPAKGDELVVGPYQGTLGCLRIAFGRGVCGAAAAERRTLIVPDVEAFPGHIACDSRSKSEIVIPVFDPAGELIAVFDVDSTELASFDETDQAGLERILRETFAAR
jgi:L-methionine (R)-S-oxide reductase